MQKSPTLKISSQMNKKAFNLEKLLRENIRNLKAYSSARDEYQSVTNGMIFIDAKSV